MIYYPKIYGLCSGASDALLLAYKSCNKGNVVVLKEILHNTTVIDDLKAKGINTINNLEELSKDNEVIIRAHGEALSTYEYLKGKGIKYQDATCKNVFRVHKLVQAKYRDGYQIVIVGKKTHPEVIGTNGWCNNEAIIIEKEEDITDINKEKIFVVAQTTISEEFYFKILNLLKEKYSIEYENTICKVQTLIQNSSLELAKNMDVMLIVGGANSSNTMELYNKCSKVCKSFFISTNKDIKKLIANKKISLTMKIGITGGASTPKSQIKEYAEEIEKEL